MLISNEDETEQSKKGWNMTCQLPIPAECEKCGTVFIHIRGESGHVCEKCGGHLRCGYPDCDKKIFSKLTKWTDLEVFDCDSDHRLEGRIEAEKLDEFRRKNLMHNCYFGALGEDWEDEDQCTWGPQSNETVDWSGFEEYLAKAVSED